MLTEANMTPRTITLTVIAIVGLTAAAPALAAKGIITRGRGTGSGMGTILVTEPREAGLCEIGLQTGDVIPFHGEAADAVEGDLVTFDVVAGGDPVVGAVGINVKLDARAGVVEGDVRGGLTVGPGRVLVIKGGGVVNGSITVRGGTLVMTDGGRVTGRIHAHKRASVVMTDAASVGRGFDIDDAYFTVRSTGVFEGGLFAQGYCVKCKAKREITDATEVVQKNQRKAMQGTCPTCGTGMFRILGKA